MSDRTYWKGVRRYLDVRKEYADAFYADAKAIRPQRLEFLNTMTILGREPVEYLPALHYSDGLDCSEAERDLLCWLLTHILIQSQSGHIRTDLRLLEEEMSDWLSGDALSPEVKAVPAALGAAASGLIRKHADLFGTPFIVEPIPLYDPARDPVQAAVDTSAERIYPPFIVRDDSFIYLLKRFKEEERLLSALESRLQSETSLFQCNDKTAQDASALICRSGPYGNLEPLLTSVLKAALYGNLLIISGGPGTGKTTTVSYLLLALLEIGRSRGYEPSIALAAPTGRAAARLMESMRSERDKFKDMFLTEGMPETAETLHKLLRLYPGAVLPAYHREAPIPADILVVDEASMVDISLMRILLEAVSEQTLLILVGDKDQLPSVEAGALLADFLHLCESPKHLLRHQTIQLTEVYRSNTDILDLAAPVIQGRTNDVLQYLHSLPESGHSLTYEPLPPFDRFLKRTQQEFPLLKKGMKGFRYSVQKAPDHTEDIQPWFVLYQFFAVLSPLRKGLWGAANINDSMDILYGGKAGALYHGRPLMITGNDYSLNLFNGDRGVLLLFEGVPYGVFPGEGDSFRFIPYNRLKVYETGFVQTIHKSQGSEFERIYLLLPPGADRVLTREIFYTGLTRAKNKVDLFSDDDSVAKALAKGVYRNSRVREFLSEKN